MRIYILRHGDAQAAGYNDADRPLSDVGCDQARSAVNLLHKLVSNVDIILSSPLLRAKQTADIALVSFSSSKLLITQHLVVGSDPEQLVKYINSFSRENILLVGHEPHLSSFIVSLIGGTGSIHLEMSKAGLACVETPLPIKLGNCTLRWLLSSNEINKLVSLK
ncbi:MAG: phosphohistidine phosphatase SixA [Ignavibacteriales bacterium]|nr:phosphohistidine phosphatase SixA [Ignavibacteriales bacterium]